MRLVTLLFLLLLALSGAYGQTNEEQVRFVDGALNRISNRITEREASLTNQIEQTGREEKSLRQHIESIVKERAKTEQEAVDIAQTQREIERAPKTSKYYQYYQLRGELQERAFAVSRVKSELKHKEELARTQASAAREKYIGLEAESKKTIADDAAIKAELKMLNEDWRTKPGDKELAKLVGAIKAAGRELALKSIVNITSQNSTGTKTTGARVRFQGDDEHRNGITPKYSGLIDCTEKNLDIAWYYFWTERGGKDTSDRNYGKFIVYQVENVQIVEER